MGEKFNMTEISELRNELLKGGLDSLQSAELLQLFLMGRGYGVAPDAALDAASRVGGSGCSLDVIRTELNKIARVM
jgi:DNA repair protein RadC